MSLRVCPLCQAEFLEYKNTCTHCGVALVDPSEDVDIRLLEDDEQVVYDLSGWPIDAQTDASMLLAESGLPHLWDGTDLIVPAEHEESADRLLERIEDAYGLVGDEELDMLGEEAAEARVDAGVTEGSEDSSGGETEFDLAGWTVAQRMELVERLVELHIPHRWEGPLLVVPTVRDDEVEALTDEAEGIDAEAEVIEPREAASLMFLAAQRMRKGKVSADQYEIGRAHV